MHLSKHDFPRACRIWDAHHPQHVNNRGKQAPERELLSSEHHLVTTAAHAREGCLFRVAEWGSSIVRVEVNQPRLQ